MWGHVCQHCKLVPRWALESLSATWEGFHFSTQAWSITINWDGVRLWRDLKVKRSILNFIRSAIGSQCRSFNSSVTWSYFLEHVTKRAAAFCTDCNFCSKLLPTPYSRELQKSNFEVTKAWTKISVVFTDKYLQILAMLRKWWNARSQVELSWWQLGNASTFNKVREKSGRMVEGSLI